MARQWHGNQRKEHWFQAKSVTDAQARRQKEPGCARAGRARGPDALFALAETNLCGDAFILNFQVWETESVLSPSESVPFSTQDQFACHSPDSAILLQWTSMFSPGRAALAKCYGLEGAFPKMENRVNSIKALGSWALNQPQSHFHERMKC